VRKLNEGLDERREEITRRERSKGKN